MSRAASRSLAALRASAVAPLIAVAAVYLLVGYSQGYSAGSHQRYAGDPSIFIRAGSEYATKPALLPTGSKIFDGTGYDGQFYFYLAQDPFLRGVVASPSDAESPQIDYLGYRYQRILYPLAAWLASGGSADPDLLQWILPLLNLASILGSGFLLARFLSARGRSPWWSVLYMLSLGMLAGAVNDLADPFATGLFVAGMIWWYEGRRRAAVVALTLTLLARGTFVLPVAALGVFEVLRLRRAGLPFLIPAVVWVAWQGFLRIILTAPVVPADAERPALVPLRGLIERLKTISEQNAVGVANWQFAFIGVLMAICGYLLWRSGRVGVESIRAKAPPGTRDRVLLLVAGASVVLMPFYTSPLWRTIESYSRYSAPVAGLLLMIFAVRRWRAPAALAGALFALTLVNPVIGFLPTANGVLLTFPQAAPAASTVPMSGGAHVAVRIATSGFAPRERAPGQPPWRWAVAPRATMALSAPGAPRAVLVSAVLRAPPGRTLPVRVTWPGGGTVLVQATPAGAGIRRPLTLGGAPVRLAFSTAAPPSRTPGDPRSLYFQLVGLSVRAR